MGKDVYEFKPGDRVAALHAFGTEYGSFAEYAVAPDWTTFHVPHNVPFEEAATVPPVGLTAAIALYVDMKLPVPWNPRKSTESDGDKVPILIYGVTSAVGAFAAKCARLSGLGPTIGVASRAATLQRHWSTTWLATGMVKIRSLRLLKRFLQRKVWAAKSPMSSMRLARTGRSK